MAKIIAIIFFAILAFQTALARPGHNQEQRNKEVQELLKQIQSFGGEAVSAVQNAHVDDDVHRSALSSQAYEFAQNIHEASYVLQQAVDDNQGGQGQQALQEVIKSFKNIEHFIKQAIDQVPNQLKSELKTQVENLVTEAQKLGPIIQQPQHSKGINDQIDHVLDDLVAAVYQLQVHIKLVGQNQEEIKNQIQTVTNEVVQSVTSNNEAAVRNLVYHSHHLAHHVYHVIQNLEKELNYYDGEVDNVLQEVVNKLSEIQASLERAGHGKNNNQVSELQNLLKSSLSNIAVQVERLVQTTYSVTATDLKTQNLRNVVDNALARFLVGAKQLQRDVQATIQNNQ